MLFFKMASLCQLLMRANRKKADKIEIEKLWHMMFTWKVRLCQNNLATVIAHQFPSRLKFLLCVCQSVTHSEAQRYNM